MDYKFGNKLLQYRKKIGLSQTELATKLGVTNKAVSKWENGSSKPSTELLPKIALLFETSIDELLKQKEKEKSIHKIVITGGPCAGKTTAMSWIQNKFTKDGYSVIFVPETATEILSAGINPNIVDMIEFEEIITELQLEKEKLYEKAALKLKNDKILIVYDRGTLDVKAYVKDAEYRKILRILNRNEVELLDNYDAVFHLVTAAKGASEYYTLENNQARYETKEQAIKIDDNLINSWTGHQHLRIIDNSTNFEDKMKNLIKEISHFLGEPDPFEIERKYLIEMPDLSKIKNYKKVEIIQTYLKSKNDDEIRIRQRGNDGDYIYYQTIKKKMTDTRRVEVEKRLSQKEYLNLLMEADTDLIQIRKNRYCFVYKYQYFELDIYPFMNDKAILEIELKNESDKIVIPKYLKVLKEVTEDNNYKNYTLAKKYKN